MTQQTLPSKSVQDRVKELWRCQASQNITSHDTLCACEDSVLSGIKAASMNSKPLLDWDEYNQVAKSL